MMLLRNNDNESDIISARWQVFLSVITQCVSIVIIFVGGCVLMLFVHNDVDDTDMSNNISSSILSATNQRMLEDTSSSPPPSLSINILLHLFQQLLGGTFIAYALGTGLLLLPILHDIVATSYSMTRNYDTTPTNSSTQATILLPSSTITIGTIASYAHYCSTMSTSIFALCLIIVSMIIYSKITYYNNYNNDDEDVPSRNNTNTIYATTTTFIRYDVSTDDSDSHVSETYHHLSNLCFLLLSMGMAILLLSSISTMIRFWPISSTPPPQQSPARRRPRPTVRDHVNDNEEESVLRLLQTPLISEVMDNHDIVEEMDHDIDDHDLTPTILLEHGTPTDNNNGTTTITTPATATTNGTYKISATRRLLQLASSQLLFLYLGCLVLLLRLPFSLAIPHFVATTIAAVSNANYTLAHSEITLLLIAGTIDAVLDFWAFFLFGYANQRIVRKLRIDLFTRLLCQEVAFFDRHSSGELSSRLNSDCSEMAGDLTWFFRFSIESVVRITGITVYMIVRCPLLGTCAISIIPIVAIINKSYGDWLQKNSIHVQDALADANMVAQEALSNIRTVISFVTESHECERYENRIERQYQLNIQQLFMSALYYMVVSTFLINTVVQGVFLWVGSILIERDELTPGILLAFMLYQAQLQSEVLSLMNSYTSLIKSSGAGDKVFALIDRQPPPPSTAIRNNTERHCPTHIVGSTNAESNDHSNDRENVVVNIDSNHNNFSVPQKVDNQHVAFANVTFAYPSRPENIILTDFSLIVPRGETVALVGTSGGGKTTIMNLLQRFYDPCSGQVLIYGTDLRTMDVMAHRKQIGIVTQDPILFQGTIRDNITYGCIVPDQVRDEDVIHAAQLAHAHDFIRTFPDGYDTMIGERGVQLSGGQKQRIAIARALIVQPTLLLLDEATSSLDTESEIAVQNALDELLSSSSLSDTQHHSNDHRSITTVVIAHRLRTVQNANKIVVVQHGRVVEVGTHTELLLAPTGIYRQMVELSRSSGVLPG